jgi:hypothetical protein
VVLEVPEEYYQVEEAHLLEGQEEQLVLVVLQYLLNILCRRLYEYSYPHGHHIDIHILVEVVVVPVVLAHIEPPVVLPYALRPV